MHWIIVGVALLVLLAVVEWLHFNLVVRKGVPGPWGWPVLGCLPSVLVYSYRENLTCFFERLMDHGPVVMYRVLGIGTIIQSSRPEDLAHVLADKFDNYEKPPLFPVMMDSFGRGIFVTNGPEWVEQRKVGSRSFRVHDIRRSVEILMEETGDMCKVLEEKSGADVNIMTLCASVTLSAFTRLALNDQLVTVSEEETPFAFHFNRVLKQTSARFQNPLYWLGPRIFRSERELAESTAYIDGVIFDVVRRGRERLSESDTENNLVAHFLQALPDASDRYIRDILFNFILAGRDTTAITLSMGLYFLAVNPRVQQKIFEEAVAGGIEAGQTPSYDLIDKGTPFPYLNAFVRETLRLAPPVPIDPKVAISDDVLPGSGVQVKKGFQVEWCMWNLGRSKETFGPDANVFRPERWLEQDSLPSTNKPPFIPFQFGPRICLGMRMALIDLQAAFLMLVREFEFKPTLHTPTTNITITLVVDKVVLKAEKRKM